MFGSLVMLSVVDPYTTALPPPTVIEIDTMTEVVRECAFLVPLPDEPLPCSKTPESEQYGRAERSSYFAN